VVTGPKPEPLLQFVQDLDLKTWVSGPQREVSGLGSQDLGFRPSVFGSQDLGFRTSKALHPTVVLSFSHHFSLRPVVTDRRRRRRVEEENRPLHYNSPAGSNLP